MDLFTAIASRYSYRGEFLPQEVPQEDLEKILQAGICAPSGFNAQTTHIAVVRNAALRQGLADIMGKPTIATAPVVLVPYCERRQFDNGLCFEVEDYAACVENMLLAITALGYASVWLDGATRQQGRDERIIELLGLPQDMSVRCLLPVGIAAEPGVQKEKKELMQRVVYL